MKNSFIIGILAILLSTGCGKPASTSKTPAPPTNAPSETVTQAAAKAPEIVIPLNDIDMPPKVVGIWKYTHNLLGSQIDDTFSFAGSGAFTHLTIINLKQGLKRTTSTGTWHIKGGNLVMVTTKVDPPPQGIGSGEVNGMLARGGITTQFKVLNVTDHELDFEIEVIKAGEGYGSSTSMGTAKMIRQ